MAGHGGPLHPSRGGLLAVADAGPAVGPVGAMPGSELVKRVKQKAYDKSDEIFLFSFTFNLYVLN